MLSTLLHKGGYSRGYDMRFWVKSNPQKGAGLKMSAVTQWLAAKEVPEKPEILSNYFATHRM